MILLMAIVVASFVAGVVLHDQVMIQVERLKDKVGL